MIITLNILKSAGVYDAEIETLYNEKRDEWASCINNSMSVMGEVLSWVGHWNFDKPSFSDFQAFALAATSLLLQEDDTSFKGEIGGAFDGMWDVMRFERNPTFTFPYAYFARYAAETKHRIKECIEDLRDFPNPDQKIAYTSLRDDTDEVQPLANRVTNTNYWKSSPFRRALPPHDVFKHPQTGARQQLAGQDYLLAYWMGRYFKLIPEH